VRAVRAGALCAIALVTSSLLARVHPFGDAGLYQANSGRSTIMERTSVPADVRAALTAKCADCHSMQSRTPLYGRFAPVSWMLERDIMSARKAMNLSEWENYSAEQQHSFAAEIAQQTRTRKMPLLQYRMIHWNARITDADVQNFTAWARQSDRSNAGSSKVIMTAGDPVRGRQLFEKTCAGCHALGENREGPRLRDVYGRTSGTAPGYEYSTALKEAKVIWNDSSLEQWLTDPDAFIPGNNMDFQISQPQERQDLIRFLKEMSKH
jgi:cytochrome c